MKIKFSELSDYLNVEDIECYFMEFLNIYSGTRDNVEFALSELFELSDRQWHTYTLLKSKIKQEIEKYIFEIIDYESTSIMEWILVIIPRLGLGEVFKFIINRKQNILNNKIIQLIEESEKEYGKTVDNPYSSLEFFK